MNWLRRLRQKTVFAKIEYVTIDLDEVQTVEDIKQILVLMATPNTCVVLTDG